jgi:hypothetical protein
MNRNARFALVHVVAFWLRTGKRGLVLANGPAGFIR